MGNFHRLSLILPVLILINCIQNSSSLPRPENPEPEKFEAPGEPGGLGPLHPADADSRRVVYALAKPIHLAICKKQGIAATKCVVTTPLTVISYKSQVVSGSMYYVKIQWNNLYWHAKIYEQTWSKTLRLEGIQGPKKKNDPILYFETP